MSSASLRAYLIKNYASSPSSNKKLKKKKRKKKKKDSVLDDQRPVSIPRSNVVDPADDEITAMPNLNDGSGWNQSPNPNHSILASNGKRKRDHEEAESHRSTSTNRIRTKRYDTDSDDDDDSDIEVSRRKSDSDSDLEVDRKPMSSMKPEYAVDSDSDIEVTRRSTDSVKREEKVNNTQNDNQTVYRNEKGRRITKEEYNAMKRKKGKKEEEEMEWAGGLVQKYESFESQVMAQRQRFNQLARYKDDAEMNVDLQNEHRAEDPLNQMDGYEQIDEIQRNGPNGENSGRPMYRGKPWVNRYGILPGYRWDGVDRSNGFEQKKLLHQSRNKDLKKKRYKWANEDM